MNKRHCRLSLVGMTPKKDVKGVSVLRYEVRHQTGDTDAARGSIVSLDVTVDYDPAQGSSASITVDSMPMVANTAMALRELGRWLSRVGEALESVPNEYRGSGTPPFFSHDCYVTDSVVPPMAPPLASKKKV